MILSSRPLVRLIAQTMPSPEQSTDTNIPAPPAKQTHLLPPMPAQTRPHTPSHSTDTSPCSSASSLPAETPSTSIDSVPFPTSIKSANNLPQPEHRLRYKSSLSRNAIARSQSTRSGLAGKLQSLRKKIENELSRKRPANSAPNGTTSSRRSKKPQKGTVAGLRPSPALTVPEAMSVADASQLCAAKRTDCVLVVDEDEGLSGIFTAKDLAFRVSNPLPRNAPH